MNHRRNAPHRGFTIYVVLIVVTIAALMSASVLYSAQAQRAAADAAARRVQSRAIAWSGVQAAMEELRARRDDLIRGGEVDLPEDWPLFSDDQGRRAVARLVASDGRRLISESGKIDVNTATEAMLAHVPGLDAEIAKRIVGARAGRKFLSIQELAGIEGLRGAFTAEAGGERSADASQDAFVPPDAAVPPRPLGDLLTVFSFEPNVQAGMGRNAESHIGVRRIALSGTWSERLGHAITERFDEGVANGVKSLMQEGTKFEKESDIVKVLRRFRIEPKDWAEVLDVFCGDASPYRLGRIDVLTAPQEVLACVPGIDQAAAEQIVLRRGKLAPEQRLSLVWLATESILTEEQFEQAIDHLAIRSTQWRVVVEAGFIESNDEREAETPALSDRVVVESVIDVSSERPRIAYLREITMAEAARQVGPLRPPPKEKKEEPAPSAASAPPGAAVSSTPPGGGRSPPARGARVAPLPSSRERAGPAEGAGAAADEADPRLGRWTPGRQ